LATFVDCEATSLNGYCTEIGFAQVWQGHPPDSHSGTTKKLPDCEDLYVRSDSRLVCVEEWLDDYLKWDPAAEKMTGISRSMLLQTGYPANQVAIWLNHDLADLTVYSDARIFDTRWIDQVFHVAEIKRRFKIVQVERVKTRWDIDKKVFMAYCKSQFSTLHGDDKPHRAEADAVSWAYAFASCWDIDLLNRSLFAKLIGSWL
jgi:hypothetical protein